MKRFIAVLLTLCTLLGCFPVFTVFAEDLNVTINDFTNGTGKVIETFSGDSVVTTSVTAKATTQGNAIVVVTAVYAGATLINIHLNHTTVSTFATTEIRNTYDMSALPDATSIKVMVWDKDSIADIVTPKTLERQDVRDLVFGALQSSPDNYESNLNAGINTVLFELHWNNFYVSEGQKNTSYISRRKEELEAIKSLGYKVMLGLGTQYTPDWVYGYNNSRFVNQYGDAYTTTEVGDTAVNAVFNNNMREKLETYMADVAQEFGSDFDIVRLGLMRYGEFGYPGQTFNGKSNSYWAFDDIAQGKTTGLPDGLQACPVPGWTPGSASPNGEAYDFANWYMDALLNYQTWQINTCDKYFDSEMAVLYPSWGMRTGQLEAAIAGNLSASTSAEKNGEIQRGFDFERLIMAIDNPNVIVYCTWIDANAEWTYNDDQTVPSESNNFSPVHYMAYYAKKNPLKLKVMGENTGGGNLSNMTLCFERMKKYDLDGIMWAFESDLYDTSAPTLSDYASYIADYIEFANK